MGSTQRGDQRLVALLRVTMWGIWGTLTGGAASLWLALRAPAPTPAAALLAVSLPIAGAAAGAGLRAWTLRSELRRLRQ